MKEKLLLLVVVLLLACLLFVTLNAASHAGGPRRAGQGRSPRAVAVTFDDLPAPHLYDIEKLRALTRKLLDAVKAHRVPAIGFVNEGKLTAKGAGEVEARTRILKMWTDAGLELGNHTYSHRSLFNTPLGEFQADVVRGEPVTKRLLAGRAMKLRYFRHPFLNVGPDAATKTAFEQFLAGRGYTIAPVTVDNADYLFARHYADAEKAGDRETMRRIAEAYVPYLEETVAYYEQLSRDLLGYEVKQTLLLHANLLNADHFGEVAKMFERRGYRFISLAQALEDKAYALPDHYTGRAGFSWLQRWALVKKHKFASEPDVPQLIKDLEQRGTKQ
jgi:peptidoglycan/xylan/chitin deacetylase (PgdA/CDA1 family)